MPKHDETDPLQPKKTTNFGRLAVAAAALSFLLGAAAATAIRGSGLRGSDLHETVETSKSATTLIKLASDPTKCITVQKEGGEYNQWSELVLKDCSSRWDKKDVGQAFTVTVGDGGHGKITYRVWQGPAYRNGELCVTDRRDFTSRGSGVGLSECDDADRYADFFWDSDTKTISLPGKTYEDDYHFDDDALKGNHLCVDVGTAEKYPKEAGKGDIGTKNPLILSPCQDGRYQLWDVATTVAPAVPPTLDYQCDPSGDWLVEQNLTLETAPRQQPRPSSAAAAPRPIYIQHQEEPSK